MYIPFRALFGFLAILLLSWILLHVLAVLGIFLALAYPIWWLFFPRATPCIFCNSLPPGSSCPLCHRPINKNYINPASISSVFKNSILILLISLFSIGLVFFESKILYYFGIPATPQTASFVIPPKGQYRLEEIFPLPLNIIGISTPINAVQMDISFDPRKLKVVEISTQDSFANIFIQKEINNDQGYARLTGGLPNPGFFADHGLFGTIFFQGIQPGIATVEYLPSSKILANDGRGTNILKNGGSVSFLILPEKITSSESSAQSALFETQVLGATTTNSQEQQLIFFEPHESVLGDSTTPTNSPTTTTPPTPNKQLLLLDLLARINDSILRFWTTLIQYLRPQ